MTILEPLMPWTVSAIFMATTLGVPTWNICHGQYSARRGMFSLLLAAFYPLTGFRLKRCSEPAHRERTLNVAINRLRGAEHPAGGNHRLKLSAKQASS